MNWTHAPAGVLTDMDGTLVDSTAAIERQWTTFLDWYGLPSESLPSALHGKRAEEHIRDLLPESLVGEAVSRMMAQEQADVDGVAALPGAADVLAQLDEAGVPWAMVTSGTAPVVRARMEAAGLPQPRLLVSAEDVTAGKPDPMPYQEGRRRLGVDGPLLALEDAPVGVRSARRAGCAVAALTTTHTPDQLDADIVVRTLADLRVSTTSAGSGYLVSARRPDLRRAS